MRPRRYTEAVLLKLTPQEKEGFTLAAQVAGVTLADWARERLRMAATHELQRAGRRAPFAPPLPGREGNG